MVFTDLIEKKKRGGILTEKEIRFFVKCVCEGSVPDYCISAFLMAAVLKGMNFDETLALTFAMRDSGEILGKGEIKGVCADKHSTGGVSDSTTLAVVPICCALGVKFAKLSGRGLGHTGGTIDKLESFTGFNANLSEAEFVKTVNSVGGAVSGQTDKTVPADKKLYALRDVTCTVDSIPLIASSVMSKKLASFADVIVLDVKYGSGAFMKTAAEAEELARMMVKIGKAAGRKISAAVTSMNCPLGDSVGCNAEVRGAIEVLNGKNNDLAAVSLFLAKQILVGAGFAENEAEAACKRVIQNGAALKKLAEIVTAQGGDASAVYEPEILEFGRYKREIICEKGGFINKINCEYIGSANVITGGGRMRKDDVIDHESAIVLGVRTASRVRKGDILATLYTNNEPSLKAAAEKVSAAFEISDAQPEKEALIHKLIV